MTVATSASEDIFTIEELAEYLKVPVDTVRRWRSDGTGPRGARLGKHVRYTRSDVEAWLESKKDGGVQ